MQNISVEYFNIAENYLAQKNYSKAIENYNLSLRSAKKENINQTKYQLAKAYALNKNYTEAEDILFDLYQQEQTNSILAQSLAYCYAKNGKIQQALTMYKTIYVEKQKQEDVANNYFLLLLEAKEFDEANSVLEQFKADFPESTKIKTLEDNLKKATEPVEKPQVSEENKEQTKEQTKE